MARIMTLSDDDIETIRIHLSAIKEGLCNQGRYGEATYYQKLIEKFLSSNVIRCKDCKYWNLQVGNVKGDGLGSCGFHNVNLVTGEGFCYWADRRGEADG